MWSNLLDPTTYPMMWLRGPLTEGWDFRFLFLFHLHFELNGIPKHFSRLINFCDHWVSHFLFNETKGLILHADLPIVLENAGQSRILCPVPMSLNVPNTNCTHFLLNLAKKNVSYAAKHSKLPFWPLTLMEIVALMRTSFTGLQLRCWSW